jgi:hypothetical protein
LGTQSNVTIGNPVAKDPAIGKAEICLDGIIRCPVNIIVVNVYASLVVNMAVFHGGDAVPEPCHPVKTDHVPGTRELDALSDIVTTGSHGTAAPFADPGDRVIADVAVGRPR